LAIKKDYMITILGGIGKNGKIEAVKKVCLKVGQIISIVGPTGSGKTQLINDINCGANRNTPSNRRVIFGNGVEKNITIVSQSNTFLSDLSVGDFLEVHAEIRKRNKSVIKKTIDFANELTGEKITSEKSMTQLSGGQTRALMIADALIVSNSTILLLDEIENAGINKIKVLDILKKNNKILVFVSHDPRIILSSDMRIIMDRGMMNMVIYTTKEEKEIYKEVMEKDDSLNIIKEKLRCGKILKVLK
jgi:ABC-type lipoprotein export system ATPase subunit